MGLKGEMAWFQTREDTSSASGVNAVELRQGKLSPGSQGSGSETLKPLSSEATEGAAEKPSFNIKPKICAWHCVFIWHSSTAVILSSCRYLCLKEDPQPWNRSQRSVYYKKPKTKREKPQQFLYMCRLASLGQRVWRTVRSLPQNLIKRLHSSFTARHTLHLTWRQEETVLCFWAMNAY